MKNKRIRYLAPLLPLFFFFVPHAAHALTFVGSASTTGTSGTLSVSLTALTGGADTAARAGDLVIAANMFVTAVTSDTGDPGMTSAGYTEMADLWSNDTQDANLSVNYKIMGSSPDASAICNGSPASTLGNICLVHVWRGADEGKPFDVASTTAWGPDLNDANCGTTISNASITPVTPGAYVLSVCAGTAAPDVGYSAVTPPTGYGNKADAGAAGSGHSIKGGIASKAWTSGSETPGLWAGFETPVQRSWASVTLAIKPATPSRHLRLFEGFTVKFTSGRIILY